MKREDAKTIIEHVIEPSLAKLKDFTPDSHMIHLMSAFADPRVNRAAAQFNLDGGMGGGQSRAAQDVDNPAVKKRNTY